MNRAARGRELKTTVIEEKSYLLCSRELSDVQITLLSRNLVVLTDCNSRAG